MNGMPDRYLPAATVDGPPETLYSLLAGHARHDPDFPALLAPGHLAVSYGSLMERIERISNILPELGVRRGDRVAVPAEPGIETAIRILGVSCHTACVPINPELTTGELRRLFAATRTRAVFSTGPGSSPIHDVVADTGIRIIAESSETRCGGKRPNIGFNLPPWAGEAIVLHTSGTTAHPKVIPCDHRHLSARAGKLKRLLDLRHTDRCLNLMPLCYAHGLFTGLIGPLAAGGSVVLPKRFDQSTFMMCLLDLSPTWYTAGATHHQAIANWLKHSPEAARGHVLRFIRSSSASLPRTVQQQLERELGVPVVEGYGTSETGGPVTCNPPTRQRKPGTVGTSPDNDVAVMDREGNLLSPGLEGEVVVRGATLTGGYENDPEASREAFRDGWFHTGDLGVFDSDGYLVLKGRIKDLINRGGEKVAPAEVDAALQDFPGVADAVTFGIPHSTLGEEVAVAVVPAFSVQIKEQELKQYLQQRLAPFKVPKRIILVDEIPRGPTGKPLRRSLANRFATQLSGTSDAREEHAPLESILLAMWSRILERDDIGPDDDFFLMGGDSISAVELLTELEQELSLSLPPSSLIEMPTVREFSTCLQDPLRLVKHARTTSDMVGINTGGKRYPLFAVCGRYGYAFRLLLTGRRLGPDQPMYALQPPNMDWESVGCRSVEEMAAYYINRIRSVQRNGPYRLLGTSFGGLVVYEMALQLQKSGEEVKTLAIVDTQPPRKTEAGNNMAEPVDPDAMRVAQSHRAARQEYRLSRQFEGELIYLYCTGDLVIPARDRRRLWETAASAGVRWLKIPGLHGQFHKEPQFSALLEALEHCLEGNTPSGSGTEALFDRRYELVTEPGGESIRDADGILRHVTIGSTGGALTGIRLEENKLELSGWALQDQGYPADTLVVFVDDQFAGCGSCGTEVEDTGNRFSGFRFEIPWVALETTRGSVLRIFVLSGNRAHELPHRTLSPTCDH